MDGKTDIKEQKCQVKQLALLGKLIMQRIIEIVSLGEILDNHCAFCAKYDETESHRLFLYDLKCRSHFFSLLPNTSFKKNSSSV